MTIAPDLPDIDNLDFDVPEPPENDPVEVALTLLQETIDAVIKVFADIDFSKIDVDRILLDMAQVPDVDMAQMPDVDISYTDHFGRTHYCYCSPSRMMRLMEDSDLRATYHRYDPGPIPASTPALRITGIV